MNITLIKKRIALTCIIAIAVIFLIYILHSNKYSTSTPSANNSKYSTLENSTDVNTNSKPNAQNSHESIASMSAQTPISETETLWVENDYTKRSEIAARVWQESIENNHNKELQKVLASVAQSVETIRWIRRGKYDELIVLPKNTSPGDKDLSMVKEVNSENYLILGAGPNIGKAIFRVLSDGSVTDASTEHISTVDKERVTMQWPMSQTSGGLAFPTNGFIICTEMVIA